MAEETAATIPATATISLDPGHEGSQQAGQRRANDRALAASVPDENHILMKMIKLLLGLESARWIAVPIAGVIMLIYVVAKFGVPALLAVQALVLQVHQDQVKLDIADREVARQQVTATTELISAVKGISGKIDEQGQAIEGQARQLERLSGDVAGLKKTQDDAGRRLDALSAQQKALQLRLEKR